MSFNIIASGRAGICESPMAGQGATMSRHFGECLSGENSGLRLRHIQVLIAAMSRVFLAGLALIIMARTS